MAKKDEYTIETYDQMLSCERLVVQFMSDWDPASRIFKSTFQKAKMDYPNIRFVKIKVEKNTEVAKILGIEFTPSFISYKNGKVFKKFVGAFEEELKKVCDDLSVF